MLTLAILLCVAGVLYSVKALTRKKDRAVNILFAIDAFLIALLYISSGVIE